MVVLRVASSSRVLSLQDGDGEEPKMRGSLNLGFV